VSSLPSTTELSHRARAAVVVDRVGSSVAGAHDGPAAPAGRQGSVRPALAVGCRIRRGSMTTGWVISGPMWMPPPLRCWQMTADPPPEQAFWAYVTRPGIVRLTWRPGLCITGLLAAQAMTAVDALNGDQQRPLLVGMAGTATPTRDARQRFGRRCTASRIALLGESVVDRVHASFPPDLRRADFPVPTRFFTSEPAALAWLLNGPHTRNRSATGGDDRGDDTDATPTRHRRWPARPPEPEVLEREARPWCDHRATTSGTGTHPSVTRAGTSLPARVATRRRRTVWPRSA
jgi:hypothetical protein